MSKKARGKKGKGRKRAYKKALARVLAIAGSIAGVLALGATGVMARGALKKASSRLGRSLEGGLAHLKQSWPIVDFSSGVPTSRGLS